MPPTIHATAVVKDGAAVLLQGPPGSGKSDLALRLIDRGWLLLADDRVIAAEREGRLHLSAPETIAGRIEVRGLGILPAPHVPSAPACLVVDLSVPPQRLPDPETRDIAGVSLPLLRLNAFEASAAIKVEWALASALASAGSSG